jgi:hypothetical protein
LKLTAMSLTSGGKTDAMLPRNLKTNERVRPELWPKSGLPVRELYTASGVKFLVDGDYDGEYFSQFRWYSNVVVAGKIHISHNVYPPYTNRRTSTMYLSRMVLGEAGDEKDIAHHINGNTLDCRSANLRWITNSQRAALRPIGSGRIGTGKSGYVGVHPIVRASGQVDYQAYCATKYLGTFATAIEAARAYDKAALARYGFAAQINYPREHM